MKKTNAGTQAGYSAIAKEIYESKYYERRKKVLIFNCPITSRLFNK